MNLQKSFNSANHQMLLPKLNDYGFMGFKWLVHILSVKRNQYLSISGFDSGLAAINCGSPQGSVLGPLLFLLYLNDLNHAITFCKSDHFAHDTNLLCMSNSIKKLNKGVNANFKHQVKWLNANKTIFSVKTKLRWWSLNLRKRNLKVIWK